MRKLKFVDPYGDAVKKFRHKRENVYKRTIKKERSNHKSGWLFVFFACEKFIEEYPKGTFCNE